MKKAILAITVGFAISFANAGDYGGKGAPAPMAPEADFGATLSSGYMTDYIFYGAAFGEDSVWTGLDYTIDALPIALDVGVWYLNTIDNPVDYDELDLYASTTSTVGAFDVTAGFAAFFFPESGADMTYEVNLAVGTSLGFVDWSASAHYDIELEAWYFDTGVEKAFDISDTIALVVSGGVSYQIDYFTAGSEWNHAYLQASLPIALTSRATLEPYIGGRFALDAIEAIGQDDIVHGGVSISVSF